MTPLIFLTNIPGMRRRTVILLTLLIAIVVGIYLQTADNNTDSDYQSTVKVAFGGGGPVRRSVLPGLT